MPKVEKKKFGCKFILIGDEKEAIPGILLELPVNIEPTNGEVTIIFQEKGARELAERLNREADVFANFVKSQKEGNAS